jgi:hypothetical protein
MAGLLPVVGREKSALKKKYNIIGGSAPSTLRCLTTLFVLAFVGLSAAKIPST